MSSSHLEPVYLNDHYVQDVASGVVVGGGGVADQREVHVGSLGLGTALAVAYDIYGDAQLPFASLSSDQHNHHPYVQTTSQLTGFQPLVNGTKTVCGAVSPFQAAAAALHYRHSQQHGQQQHFYHQQQQTPNFDRQETATTAYPTSSLFGNIAGPWVTSGVHHPATLSFSSLDNVTANSYLTPIPSVPCASNPSSQCDNSGTGGSCTNCPLVQPLSMSTVVSVQRIMSTTAMTTASPMGNSFASSHLASSGTNGCSVPSGTNSTDQRQQQPVLSSHYTPVVSFPIPSSSSLSMSSTSSTSSSCPSTASPPSSTAFLVETNGGGQQQQHPHGYQLIQQNSEHHHPLASGVLSSRKLETSPGHNGNGGSQNAASVEESLYEITDEELREIDASLANSPDVMASRQWKYYIETNEWTRATCALMACLFTREQMANSTVLGRGGSQRARLPSNLVAYVVSTIRRRFNKPAAAVRARMAQKCKDERRFGRVAGSQNGSPGDGSPTPVAALTGKFNSSASNSGLGLSPSALSRRSRKRGGSSMAGSRQSSSSTRRCYSPPLMGSQEETGYQPTGALLPNGTCASSQYPHLDEELSNSSSQHHQLLPIPLSPPSASLSQSSLLTAPFGNDLEETGSGGTGAGGVLSQVLNMLPSPLVPLGSGVRAESGGSLGGDPTCSVLSHGSVGVVVSPSSNG